VGDFFFVNATVRRLYIHYLLNADDDQSTPNEHKARCLFVSNNLQDLSPWLVSTRGST
jgi:hypothetical protein